MTPWSDDRLEAAFAARAARSTTPASLVDDTLRAVARTGPRAPLRLALMPIGIAVLAMMAIGGGVALFTSGILSPSPVTFRDGPSPEFRTLDAGEFAFDFPASWLTYKALTASSSGGSMLAVIGTQAVEPRCGTEAQVDINCVYEQPLDPGDVRVYIGGSTYRFGTVLDRPDVADGTTTHVTIAGMPAIRDDHDATPDSYYLENASVEWSIARPTTLTNVVHIAVRARDPGSVAAIAAVEDLVASFRFTPPPTPLPDDPAAAVTAARAAIQVEADALRRGFVSVDTTAVTYLECLGDEPATSASASVRYGPGGYLDQPVSVSCAWTIEPETNAIWRLNRTYDWTTDDGRSGRYTETSWLDAAGVSLAGTFAGDPPPATSPTDVPSSPPDSTRVLGLDVIDFATALEIQAREGDDQEVAVRGWFSPFGPVSCPFTPATSPIQPVCPDAWTVLMAEPESLVTVVEDGFEGQGPLGPSFEIDLDDLERGWIPRLPDLGPATPVEIVVIGHFDDARSDACPADQVQDCRDRFVVDRVHTVQGTELPLSVVDTVDAAEQSTADEIRALIEASAPLRPILSMSIVSARAEGYLSGPSSTLWVARVLGASGLERLGAFDGVDAAFALAASPPVTVISPPIDVPAIQFGLPVIDVFAALQVRDPDHDDRELAVSGWFTVLGRFGPACFPEDSSQGPLLSPVCRTDVVEGLLNSGEDTEGPSMRVVVPTSSLPNGDPRGVPVVLYGHFDDRRALECGNAPACGGKFLVDAVEHDGELLGQQTVVIEDDGDLPPPPVWSADEAAAMALGIVGDGASLLRLVQIEPERIGELEPALVGRTLAAPWWWHVTVLDPASGRARTFAITDPLGAERSQDVYELLPDGQMTMVSLPY